MAEVKKYRNQGREITVSEAAKLAGVSDQTIYNRLKANGGDIELAILGGANRMLKLPDIEPTEKKAQELAEMLAPKQPAIPCELQPGCNCVDTPRQQTPVPAGNRELARLNDLIRALAAVDEIQMCDEVLRSQLKEKRTELIGMRSVMYGHLVDWDELARR